MTTQLQRLYPTDPSRSVDFDAVADPGKGASGAGCAKLALLEMEAKADYKVRAGGGGEEPLRGRGVARTDTQWPPRRRAVRPRTVLRYPFRTCGS